MKGQEIVTCPKCGSNKVKYNSAIKITAICGILIMIIPIVGWIAGPFMLLIALISLIIKNKKKIEPMKCQVCKHPFQISKEKYIAFKTYLFKASN